MIHDEYSSCAEVTSERTATPILYDNTSEQDADPSMADEGSCACQPELSLRPRVLHNAAHLSQTGEVGCQHSVLRMDIVRRMHALGEGLKRSKQLEGMSH